jgi:hypothetical protein
MVATLWALLVTEAQRLIRAATPSPQAECERSRRVNRYEGAAATHAATPDQSDHADSDAGAAARAAQAGRAQQAAATFAQRYHHQRQAAAGGAAAAAAGAGAAEGGAEAEGGEDVWAAACMQYAAAARTSGYDVAAVEWDPLASQVGRAGQQQAQGEAPPGAGGRRGKGASCGCGSQHHDPYHAHAHDGQAAAAQPDAGAATGASEETAEAAAAAAHYEFDDLAAEQSYVASARTAGYDAPVAAEGWDSLERLVRSAPLRYRRAARFVGYDVPAEEAAAGGEGGRAEEPRGGGGGYPKQPAGAAGYRKHYKGERAGLHHRVYYKNPGEAGGGTGRGGRGAWRVPGGGGGRDAPRGQRGAGCMDGLMNKGEAQSRD